MGKIKKLNQSGYLSEESTIKLADSGFITHRLTSIQPNTIIFQKSFKNIDAKFISIATSARISSFDDVWRAEWRQLNYTYPSGTGSLNLGVTLDDNQLLKMYVVEAPASYLSSYPIIAPYPTLEVRYYVYYD